MCLMKWRWYPPIVVYNIPLESLWNKLSFEPIFKVKGGGGHEGVMNGSVQSKINLIFSFNYVDLKIIVQMLVN